MTPVSHTTHAVAAIVDRLRALGFTDRDQLELSDRPIVGLTYVERAHEGQLQYVSVCTHEGRFCEAVIEVYATPKNTRAKRRQVNLAPIIARSLGEIEAAVGRVYALTDPVNPAKVASR